MSCCPPQLKESQKWTSAHVCAVANELQKKFVNHFGLKYAIKTKYIHLLRFGTFFLMELSDQGYYTQQKLK